MIDLLLLLEEGIDGPVLVVGLLQVLFDQGEVAAQHGRTAPRLKFVSLDSKLIQIG